MSRTIPDGRAGEKVWVIGWFSRTADVADGASVQWP